MTVQNTKNHTLAEASESRTFDSIKAAASGMKLPLVMIRAAKEAGCPAFRSNRVYEAELRAWLADNPELMKQASTDLRARKLMAECVKLETINAEKRGELIERAWMAERIHKAAGRVDAFRIKSEAEHPLLFAAAAGDVPGCREIVRKIWDEVMESMNSLESEFKE